jgi:hypothetical protein
LLHTHTHTHTHTHELTYTLLLYARAKYNNNRLNTQESLRNFCVENYAKKDSNINLRKDVTFFRGVLFINSIYNNLYRLNWTDEISGTFYSSYWIDKSAPDLVRKAAFDADRQTFTISYVGSQTVSSGKTSLRGVTSKENMIKKVCTRAIDEAIVQLQRNYDEFKVKTPLIAVSPITASIGRKEGITENSKFEVLEKQEDANGRTSYTRVGVIKPVRGKIWDNRYLSDADGFAGADLGATEFAKVSGGDFYQGLLIREIK